MQAEELQTVLGQNVRRRRQELRMTQEKLAEKLKMTQGYLSQIENGNRAATLSTVADIAEALEVTPSYLLAGEPIAS